MKSAASILALCLAQFLATKASADLRCTVSTVCYPGSECSKVKLLMMISDLGDAIVARMVEGPAVKAELKEVSEDGTRWFGQLGGKLEDVRVIAIRENGYLVSTRYVLNEQVGSIWALQSGASCLRVSDADAAFELQKKVYADYSRDVCPLIKPNVRTLIEDKETGQRKPAPFVVDCFCHYNALIADLSEEDVAGIIPLVGKDIDEVPGVSGDLVVRLGNALRYADRNCIKESAE